MRKAVAAIALAMVVLSLVMMAGCTGLQLQEYGAARSAVVDAATSLADQYLADAEYMLCKPPTVGAWLRRYGNDPVRAQAWRALCNTAPIIELPAAAKLP